MHSTFSPEEAAALLQPVRRPWWVAGGWALDLFLGRPTRRHEDLDLAILRRDEREFRRHLRTWELWTSLGAGRLDPAPLVGGAPLPEDRGALWCRPTRRSPWAFELLLSGTDGDDWLFKRNAEIRLPIGEVGAETREGVPFLRPEVVLLFKARAMRPHDREDFDRVTPALTDGARSWLHRALVSTHPGHEWIDRLRPRRLDTAL